MDKSKRASREWDCEVEYFAHQNGIAPDQVPELIRSHRNSRTKVEHAAEPARSKYHDE
jgi:hypothetical protein